MSKLTPLGTGLFPLLLSRIYAFFAGCRNRWYDLLPRAAKKIGRYTISIGCIHAGGTGKTPLALLVGEHFHRNGYETAFLSRGYGRKSSGLRILAPGQNKPWEEIGDEPALLKSSLPGSWMGIGADRYRTSALIRPHLGDKAVFILDDGFQHRKLFRHKNIVCLPQDPFTDFLIPAGTLREPLSSLKRADIICIIGLKNEAAVCKKSCERLRAEFPGLRVYILYQCVNHWVNAKTGEVSRNLPMKAPLLISGIARPNRFVELVKEAGVHPRRCLHFEDHHVFTTEEIEKLCVSEPEGFLTTEKDYRRLSTINLVKCKNIWYLNVIMTFADHFSEKDFFKSLLI